jgi:AraC-like DNA-binding protein
MDRSPRPRRGGRPGSGGPPRAATIALQRVGPLRGLVPVLAERGVDPDAVLAEFGLDTAFFEDPEHRLPLATVDRLLGRAIAASDCPHLGLLVGMRAGPSTLGVVGYLLQSAPDLGTALRLLGGHLSVNARHVALGFEVDDESATLGFGLVATDLEHGDQLHACMAAIAVVTLRALCGPGWRPSAVRLAFGAPRDVAPYREHLGLRPEFGGARSAVVFPARWLAHHPTGADPLLHRFMAARLRELAAGTPGGFSGTTRRLLGSMVSSGDCSLAAVADRLGVPPHTVKRRLASEGTSFRALRDEVRHAIAQHLLRHARMPVGDVALALGYSEPGALTRAFRRRAGASPRAWRRAADAPPRPPTGA